MYKLWIYIYIYILFPQIYRRWYIYKYIWFQTGSYFVRVVAVYVCYYTLQKPTHVIDTEKISWRRAANDHLNTGKIHIKKFEKDTTHQPG
jgi:hypothetical protein